MSQWRVFGEKKKHIELLHKVVKGLRVSLLFVLSIVWCVSSATAAVDLAQVRKIKGYKTAKPQLSKEKKVPLHQEIIAWLQLREGLFSGSPAEAFHLLRSHQWPQPEFLQKKAEGLISDQTPDVFLLSWFRDRPPLTGGGALYHLRALRRQGGAGLAEKARAYWNLTFSAQDARLFLEEFGSFIHKKDHARRASELLWEDRVEDALKMIPLLSPADQRLIQARIALIRDLGTVERLLKSLGPLDDEGIRYDRTRWRLRRGAERAEEYLISPAKLTHPEQWGKARLKVVRQKIEAKDWKTAYRIAKNHQLTEGVIFAELEWLSGWIALRHLGQAAQAQKHFHCFFEKVKTPMSRSRGAYWVARSFEAQKKSKETSHWLSVASQYSGCFYGQISLLELGRDMSLPSVDALSQEKLSGFLMSREGQILQLLSAADLEAPLKSMIEMMAEQGPASKRELLIRGVKKIVPRLTVFAAKRVSRHQNVVFRDAFPTDVVLTHRENGWADPALILGIIRQESGFDQNAESPVGAVGLMQLMKNTAKEMAVKLGIHFHPKRLKTDRAYNVQLGRSYIDHLLKNYEGDPILAVAAYNAGPGNVRQWIQRWGDPRFPKVDTIDWIESIGFGETRHYVHRVMENMMVYQRLLSRPASRQNVGKAKASAAVGKLKTTRK